MMHSGKKRCVRRLQGIVLTASLLLSGCGSDAPGDSPQVSGGRSGVLSVDLLADGTLTMARARRPGALLGLYVAEFLSRGTSLLVESALRGIDAQIAVAAGGETGPGDEDFVLLQAFADALQVDIPDLLNRSPAREESLNKYVEALRNVGTRSQERYEELGAALDTIKDQEREQRRTVSQIEREMRNAINDQDFSQAGELNRSLVDEQEALSELELEADKTEQIHDTFEDLLDIYEERLLAIESNRPALISGVRVVDVPGAEDLDILETPSRRERENTLQMLVPGSSNDEGGIRFGE